MTPQQVAAGPIQQIESLFVLVPLAFVFGLVLRFVIGPSITKLVRKLDEGIRRRNARLRDRYSKSGQNAFKSERFNLQGPSSDPDSSPLGDRE
jgi:hypothetical protein